MSTVLIIEPDRQLGIIYRRALEQCGFTVVLATCAEDGIFAADARTPDIIVLELQLSGHGGVELLHELRSYTEWAEIPVILLTSVQPYALQITSAQMECLGIVRCLYKPATTLRQLHHAIEECRLVSS